MDYRKPTYQILAPYYAYNPPKSFGKVVVVVGEWVGGLVPTPNLVFCIGQKLWFWPGPKLNNLLFMEYTTCNAAPTEKFKIAARGPQNG